MAVLVLAKQKASKSTVCHEMKRSVCSKASCVINGKKLKMLQTATTTSRRLHDNDETDISESDEYDLEEESEVLPL